MKNYLMKQAKKSFSLFLAVLMLMSCWVWVAPEKAEAAAPNSYDVVVTTGSGDMGGLVGKLPNAAEKTHRIVFTYADGTTTEKNWANAANGATGDETFTLTKWPKSIYFQVGSGNIAAARITKVTINGVEIFNGGYNLGVVGAGLIERKTDWTMSAGGTQEGQTADWTAPAYADSTTTLSPAAHTLAVINSGTNSTSTISIGNIVDQYGVYYSGSVNFSATLRAEGDVTLGQNASITTSGNSRTITIKPWFQTLYSGKQGAKLYIDWNVNNYTKSGTETIDIIFPTYKATFYANGGKIGVDDTEQKDSIEYTGEKMNIGSVIGKAPAYAAKAGFEFKGFYSTQNPDATGKTASFSGTLFEDDITIIPAATSGNGDTNWYAAWQALPITATFVTADNQLIGTVEGRYNNYMTASNMYNGDAGLNAAVEASHTAGKVKFNSNNEPIYTDGSTSYKFAGWKIIKAYNDSVVDGNEDTVLQGDVTFQAFYTKADAKTYTVSFKDGNGNDLSSKGGYKYRDYVTNVPANEPTKAQDDRYEYKFIGWAKDIGKNFYTVDEANKDENGAVIAYTHKDGAEFIVKGDATYVPVFRMVPRKYKVTYTYTVDGNKTETTTIEGFHWHDAPTMPEIKDNYTDGGLRNYLIGWIKDNTTAVPKQLDEFTVEGDLNLTAVYGKTEAAKYTINFYGKDKDGVTDIPLEESGIYEHNQSVVAPSVPQEIDTEDSLYTFEKWSPEISTSASGDADYYAIYTKKDYADIHFYNYDGTLLKETIGNADPDNLFVNDTIPVYDGAVPVKEEDPIGTYKFIGWADSQGNTVVPGRDTLSGDTYLYAQFETTYKNYTVKFVNDVIDDKTGEKVVVSEITYHYGDPITIPENPEKTSDVEYIYEFKAWSPDVSDVCYGDVTYTATYRRTPQYYTVTWFNDIKAVHTESNYQYGAKIQQAVIKDPVGYNAPETGKQWVLAYWVQCDVNGKDILVDGEQVHFVRGQRMGSEQLYFYPVFRQESNVLTVKFYKEDGTSWLGEAKVPYGANILDYDDTFKAKAPKLSDENYHYVINNWVNVNGGATVTTVNADVSVKAQYTAYEHDKKLYEIVAEPTCNVPGYAHYKCDADECTSIDYNRRIEPVADKGNPTGQLYVGTDKWTLEDYTDEDGIDYTDIKYISPSTQLIVNAEDTGSKSEPWNPDALLSRGVGKIEYYVSEGTIIDPSTVLSNDWTEIYNFESLITEALNVVLDEYKIDRLTYDGYYRGTPEEKMKKAEIDRAVDAYLSVYNANATGVVSNLNLEDGKEYVIYIKISDREGNGEVNVNYLSSGKLSFGSEAAKITVTGEGAGTKFCEKANIRIVDDSDNLKSVTLDGEEVSVYTNPGTTSANGTFVATFETTERGLHTVTVVDKHGNKTSKIFEIKGTHTNRNFTTAATCEEEGATYDLCTVCGKQDNVKINPATGHNFTTNFIDKEATCVANGTRTYVCENNCGTKLVLNPTDSEETIAQASKLVDEEKVALTVEDLAHLKATGEHTYEKVKDADGNDTAELAWIVDKAATCTKEGSRHRDCIVCGHIDARVTEVIPVDTTNGHKFYREKVTLEPTCTVEGEKTKTCRYCGYVELVENIDALGHTDGEYRIIKDATCEEAGSKILTCSVCGVDLGEEVEIPATGHAWKLKGVIYQGEDDKWYQDYECKNDSTHTKSEVVEGYQPPIPATVTFMNGDATHATIKGFVGDEISASEITAKPVKAADETYTYIFSHWADEEGNEVKFPIEVKGDATIKAVYTEKFVNYTITYYKEIEKKLSDGTVTTELQEFKKVGYLHNNEEVELADGPAKAETSLNKYVFAGWENLVDGTVYTDNVTINGADISLKAVYTDVLKKYAVTYAYSSNDIIHTYTVDAGSPAPNVFNDFDVTKKSDTKYHYEFKSWNRAAQLEKVESNIYTTPDFEAELHSFKAEDGGKIEVVTAATCFANAVNKYTCACGYTYTKEEPNTKRAHKMSDPITGEDGTVTRYCTYEDCDYEDSKMDTFTMEFFVNADDAKAIKTINYIPWGSSIDATRLPAAPKKDSSATTDYTFAGWYIKGDETKTVVDVTSLEVKQNYKFVAYFEETTREYSVIFAYDAKNVIQKNVNVKAGSSVKFEGVKPAKACDINYHYTFSGWEGYEGTAHDITVTNVQSDLYILATFKGTKHTYTSFELSAATCTNGTGTRYYCDCNGNGKFDDKTDDKFVDYYYDQTGKPLPHNFKEIERREPSIYNDGYVKYECTSCHAIETETLKYNDNTMEIRVYVEHNGAPESGVKVEIRNEVDGSVVFATTNTNGYAIFAVDKDGIYSCYAAGNYIELVKDGAGLYGAYSYTDQASCTCACHRDNIWGAIFRFFHKIIKLFTGEFKCCKNPDPMYG